MIERSRTPVSASCRVRGIGVAVSVSTCTSARSCLSFSLWATPKCCSSSTTSRPRSLNLIALPSSAWVPMTMSIVAVGDALLHRAPARPPEPAARPAPIFTGKPRKRSVKGLGVLARQQRGRHHDRDLLAVHRRDEGRAQRHLGLAEADVAADQAVHRPAGAEIVEHRVDRGLLVVGLLVGEAGAELVVGAVLDGEPRRLAQQPLGGDLDQLVRHLADAVLHAAPCASASRRRRAGRARRRSPPSRSATAARCSRPAGTACRRRHSGFRGNRAARPPPRWRCRPTKRPMP